jgi:hypothetical protein
MYEREVGERGGRERWERRHREEYVKNGAGTSLPPPTSVDARSEERESNEER